jgi:hypothetical protein
MNHFLISFGRICAYDRSGTPVYGVLPKPGDLINIASRPGQPVNVVVGYTGAVNLESDVDLLDILVVPDQIRDEYGNLLAHVCRLLQVRPYAPNIGILVDLGLGTLPDQSVRCPGKTARPGWVTTGDNYRN